MNWRAQLLIADTILLVVVQPDHRFMLEHKGLSISIMIPDGVAQSGSICRRSQHYYLQTALCKLIPEGRQKLVVI